MTKITKQNEKRMRLTDESLNSYGTWVKTDGIDYGQFAANPQMYYNHNRYDLPIGIWNDFDASDMSAVPEFDMDDPFAKKVADKYNKGHLRCSSIGIRVIETSEDKSLMKSGQTQPTITKCKLMEASITDIPSNDNAIAFYDENDNVLDLSNSMNLNQFLINKKPLKTEKSMKTLALALGLAEDATEAQILAAIQSNQNTKTNLETRLSALEAEQKAKEKARIDSLVDLAVKEQKITADKKALYLGIGETSGVDVLDGVLSGIQPVKRASEVINHGGGKSETEKKFTDYTAMELEQLKQDDKAAYLSLYEKEFGIKPDLK